MWVNKNLSKYDSLRTWIMFGFCQILEQLTEWLFATWAQREIHSRVTEWANLKMHIWSHLGFCKKINRCSGSQWVSDNKQFVQSTQEIVWTTFRITHPPMYAMIAFKNSDCTSVGRITSGCGFSASILSGQSVSS